MSETDWAKVVATITPLEPIDLDGLIDEITPDKPARKGLPFPQSAAVPPLPVEFHEETTVCFGARVTKDTPNRMALGMMLAQMAAEKGAFPVILSHVDYCGLEQFGFRVERIAGETDAEIAACEAQVCSFWNIVMVI